MSKNVGKWRYFDLEWSQKSIGTIAIPILTIKIQFVNFINWKWDHIWVWAWWTWSSVKCKYLTSYDQVWLEFEQCWPSCQLSLTVVSCHWGFLRQILTQKTAFSWAWTWVSAKAPNRTTGMLTHYTRNTTDAMKPLFVLMSPFMCLSLYIWYAWIRARVPESPEIRARVPESHEINILQIDVTSWILGQIWQIRYRWKALLMLFLVKPMKTI